MPTSFHNKVTLAGYHFEPYSLTFNLKTGIVAADVGKAVSIDASAANTVKLAGDGDTIIGRLATVEDRTIEGILVGAVELHFANNLPIKTGLTAGEVVAVGSTVIGAGSGEVKALSTGSGPTVAAPNHNINVVVAVTGSVATVLKI